MDSINQLYVITGPRGVGKTTLALTQLPPSQIDKVVVVDSENSANSFRRSINAKGRDFGKYINLLERFKDKLPSDDDLLSKISRGDMPWTDGKEQSMFTDLYQYILDQISQLKPNKYKTLVFDTGEKLEAGIAAYAEANKKKLGVTDTSYGKLWTQGVFPLYQYLLQGIWDRGIDTVIINFHLKSVWEGKRPVPGKVTHAGKKLLYYLSSLMVWLVNDSRNVRGAPAGIVLKERLGDPGMDLASDTWNPKTNLPPRIPTCDWEHINGYLANGFNYEHPDPRERLSEAEKEMISELLNDAQIKLMLTDMELEREQNAVQMAEAGILPTTRTEEVNVVAEADSDVAPQTKAEAMTRWTQSGKALPELLKRLREKGISDENIGERWSEIQ